MKAVIIMATACPKPLVGKGEKWIAQHSAGPGLATSQDCQVYFWIMTLSPSLFSELMISLLLPPRPIQERGNQKPAKEREGRNEDGSTPLLCGREEDTA